MPSRILATIFSLRPHTILMSFPGIPNPIEAFYWSLCKFMQLIEPKSTLKWPVSSEERKPGELAHIEELFRERKGTAMRM